MKTAIGIDTGGTFSDGVLINLETKEILKVTKTPTTHNDLNICINNIFNELITDNTVEMVSLSTTLATNACVENKGATCKLILFGSSPAEIVEYGYKYGLTDSNDIYHAKGCINSNGTISQEPDWDEFRADMQKIIKEYDAFAIVQLWGMRNPILEKEAREQIKKLTNKPIVCGFELSSKLNYYKRGVSALLNGRLMPLFSNFMDCIKTNLNHRGLSPKIMIVRGDGSIMNEEYARNKPVETLLSGPAASVLGACELSKTTSKAIVLDIGGTTSDMAILDNSTALMSIDGATIGNFITSTSSIDINTIVLGGDTEVKISKDKKIVLGTQRVEPLCSACIKHPNILQELNNINSTTGYNSWNEAEFYYVLKDSTRYDYSTLTNKQQKLIQYIGDQAISVSSLYSSEEFKTFSFDLTELTSRGVIMKCAMTPTDVMHIYGDFSVFCVEGSQLGVNYYAKKCAVTPEFICKSIYDAVLKKLFSLISIKLLKLEKVITENSDLENYEKLLDFASENDNKYLNISFNTDYNIIGIGAPSQIFIPKLKDMINTKCIVPENAHVGNAVGAILGKIVSHCEVSVIKDTQSFSVLSPTGIILRTSEYQQARNKAIECAYKLAEEDFYKRGGLHPELSLEVIGNEENIMNYQADDFLFFNITFKANASCNIYDTIQ